MFELTVPWILLFIPLPLMLWLILPRAPEIWPVALKVPFFQSMSDIIHRSATLLPSLKNIVPLWIIWTLLAIALSGPRWVGPPQSLKNDSYNIMLALDLSESMALEDMIWHNQPMDRLTIVKHTASQFVKNRPGDHLGLILFGTRAYLQTPLTTDKSTILNRIQDATVGLAGKTTSLGDALGLSVKQLQHVPKKGRVIILLTDGANNSGVLAPEKAAELAEQEHIKVYTIGLGAEAQSSLNNFFLNMNPAIALDEDTLKNIAERTHGKYFRATDPNSLQKIYETIDKLEKIAQHQRPIRPEKNYFIWPLGLALLFSLGFLIYLRRGSYAR